jgi:CheY-like chemotaxis protein
MKKHILLIEDDKILRENTAEILEFANYKVSIASNGKEGVKKARDKNPDLIVCDIMMPKLDGYGVFQILSKDEKYKHIPFIFLSAKTSRSDLRKGMELGADDYITKPFEESELLSAISTRLKRNSNYQEKHLNKYPTTKNNKDTSKVTTIDDLIDIFCKRQSHLYQKGDSLFCEGNRSNHLFLIKKGFIKTFKLTENGKELITGFYKENSFIGYTSSLGDFPHTENAESLEESKIIKIEKDEIIAILESNPAIALDLIELLANNIRSTKEKLVQIAYNSVRGRTAKSLLLLAKDDSLNKIVLSRTDLASLTGIAKETLIRTLSEFKDEGLIETSRTYIKIINRKALQLLD